MTITYIDLHHADTATPAPQTAPLGLWRFGTTGLIAANVLIFLVMVANGVGFFDPAAESVLKWGADYGPLTLHGQWWRMLTSTFLHFGVFHLLFNMVVLFNIGLFMEALSGRVAFVVLYLVCGLGGAALSLAWHPMSVGAGASGAVFGLYGALLGFILRNRGAIPADTIKALTKWAVVFVGYNLLYGLRPGVDMAAHFGGLVTGFVLGLFLIPPPARSEQPAPASSWRVPAAVALGLALIVAPLTALPKPGEYLAEFDRLAAMEERAIDLLNSSRKQWKDDILTADQFADVVEKQVIPPWHAGRAAIAALDVPPDLAAQRHLLLDYLDAREQSWRLTVDGIRSRDIAKFEQGNQRRADADKLADQLSR